jgi:hypothetical protein
MTKKRTLRIPVTTTTLQVPVRGTATTTTVQVPVKGTVATKAQQADVTEHALMQRINRKLAHQDEKIGKCTPRMRASWSGADDYYVVDLRTNGLVNSFDDLEGYGREIGALRPWERLASAE